MTLVMMQEWDSAEGMSDADQIEALRRNVENLTRALDDTRAWLAQVEEMYGALEHRVDLHHAAFVLAALEASESPSERPSSSGT